MFNRPRTYGVSFGCVLLCLVGFAIWGHWGHPSFHRKHPVVDITYHRVSRSGQNRNSPAKTNALSRPDFAEWLEQDPASALNYIERVDDVEERERLFCRVGRITSKNDPSEALRLVLNNVKSDQLRSEFIIDVFDDWVATAPADAARCAENLPLGEDRTKAVFVVADQWTKTNPTSAYIWMKSLPEFDGLRSTLF
jgi:hypothetical protein